MLSTGGDLQLVEFMHALIGAAVARSQPAEATSELIIQAVRGTCTEFNDPSQWAKDRASQRSFRYFWHIIHFRLLDQAHEVLGNRISLSGGRPMFRPFPLRSTRQAVRVGLSSSQRASGRSLGYGRCLSARLVSVVPMAAVPPQGANRRDRGRVGIRQERRGRMPLEGRHPPHLPQQASTASAGPKRSAT